MQGDELESGAEGSTGVGAGPTDRSRPGRLIRALAATVAAVTVLGLVGVTETPVSAAVTTTAAATTGCTGDASAYVVDSESDFVARLNALRQSKGLPTLAVNSAMIAPARGWSHTMSVQIAPGGTSADPGWLHHARDTGAGDGVEPNQDYVYLVGQTVPHWTRAAENVGVSTLRSGCTAAEIRDSVLAATSGLHDAFVRSSGHYANMVGDYNQVGIGVEITGTKLWVTVRFAKGDLPKAPVPAYSSTQLDAAGRYVDAAYQLFLSRPATSGDKAWWSPTVASGNRAALTRALAVSNEWAGSRINELYQTILGRDADAAGRANWVKAVAGGMRLEDVAAGFYGSTERFLASGSTYSSYVKGLYQDILDRPADGPGLTNWVNLLNRGAMTRSQVAAGFYGSIESRLDRVHTLYADILDRAPDAAGLQYWAGQLASMGDVVLAGTLASSDEFWLRSTR